MTKYIIKLQVDNLKKTLKILLVKLDKRFRQLQKVYGDL